MLRTGEIMGTMDGLKYCKSPPKKLFLTTQGKVPLSTPPTTPILPAESLDDPLDIWSSCDGNAQARMFRKMLSTAKDPRRLMLECRMFLDEMQGKEDRRSKSREKSTTTSPVRDESNAESAERMTPAMTPDAASESLDLKSMIEKSLREARAKRALEREKLESKNEERGREVGVVEENEAKRIKIGPLT